jgi:hypothetical protein
MPWKAIACSAKGTSHEKTGSPCQDYADFIRVNDSGEADDNGDIAIGAVCDGAGSCKYSDIGSKLAVETTLQYLQGWPKWLKKQKKDLSPAILEDYAHKVFAQVVGEVKKQFEIQAQKKSCSPKDLSCTLLVVVATPKWLAAMQIGDGFIVIREPDLEDKLLEYKLLFQPIKGEYANQTTFITASNALEVMQVKVLHRPQQFIFASTDGLERLALEIGQESKPHPPFFDTFRDAIQIRSEAEEKNSTEKWLQWEEVNNRTDDDKTILLCWYEALKSKTPISEPPIQGGSAVTGTPKPKTSSETAKPEDTTKTDPNVETNSETPEAQEASSSNNSEQKSVDLAKDFEDLSIAIEFYGLIINILSGIFWNSLWHQFFVDIKFSNLFLRNIVSLIIAVVLTFMICGVDWHLYQKSIIIKLLNLKISNPDKTIDKNNKRDILMKMAMIYLTGLILGSLCYYYIIRSILVNLS